MQQHAPILRVPVYVGIAATADTPCICIVRVSHMQGPFATANLKAKMMRLLHEPADQPEQLRWQVFCMAAPSTAET